MQDQSHTQLICSPTWHHYATAAPTITPTDVILCTSNNEGRLLVKLKIKAEDINLENKLTTVTKDTSASS